MEPENLPAGPSHRARVVFMNESGLRAGWRLLIYLGILFASYSVIIFLLFAISARLHQKFQPTGMTPGFTIIGDGLFFALMLLTAFIMSRIERRGMDQYGLPLHGRPVLRRFIVGYVFWGFLPLTVCLLIMHLCHAFTFGPRVLHGAEAAKFGIAWAVAFLAVGLAEEYLLRGYLLYTLADGIGFWPAAIVMAILFGLGHSGNSGETRIGLIAAAVFALFASVTLRYTGSLWLAVGAHAGWNWGQSFFYGVRDSGMAATGHLLEPSFHGPAWLTGGTVGPEGSAITLVLWVLMSFLFVLIYRGRRGGPILVVERKN